jgi:hypothetical protein
LLYVAGGLMCLGAFAVLMMMRGRNGPPLISLDHLVLLLTTCAGVTVGSLAVAGGKRLLAAAAPPIRGAPDIVILRAFQDDDIRFPDERGHTLKQFFPYGDRSLEEILVRIAGRYGRAAAIGNPKEELPKPGATRTYFEADDNVRWRDQATAYIDASQALLIVLGTGEGLRWEYSQVAARGALARTILIVPPGAGDDHWQTFHEAVAAQGVRALPDALPADAALVRFDAEGRARVYKATGRDSDVYASRLNQALADLVAGRNAAGEVAGPPPRRPGRARRDPNGHDAVGEVNGAPPNRLRAALGILLGAPIGAVSGASLGFLGLMLLTWGESSAFGPTGWAVALVFGGTIGFVIGAQKGGVRVAMEQKTGSRGPDQQIRRVS